MILNLVEAGRLAQGLQALGAEVTAAVIYGWLWLGCAAAGTPGVLLLGPDEVSAAFGWSGHNQAARFLEQKILFTAQARAVSGAPMNWHETRR